MLCAVSWLLFPKSAEAAGRQWLHGHVPAAVRSSPSLGRLAASEQLDLTIGLPLRNQAALTNLLRQICDPASPRYHQYLTPEQFTEMFGPSAGDYQALIDFARTNGLAVTGTHPNRLLLDVSAPVAEVEKALHVTLRLYRHPREARTFYAPDTEPSVDLAIPVMDISGLDDFVIPHPMSLKPVPANRAPVPAGGSGPGGNYRGADFRKAYAPGVTLTGSGQTVGLVEFDGYYANDITSYESQAGLAAVPLQNVLLNHFRGTPGAQNAEVALDIEMAISMAPGLSKVIVYEGTGVNTVLNRIATDNLAKQISASWGYGINSTTEAIFQQYAAQGQSFFNASGDSDAYSGAVSPPADDPNITIVGGTTLTTDGLGAWASETTWNWGGGQGTGGGISTAYVIPNWQQGIGMSANQGSTTMRNLPDVSLTADNVWVIYNNGAGGAFGGTSCAAPLWAAFTALVNQQASSHGKGAVGFVNPAIYAVGKGANYAALFHDITTGNNTSSTSPNAFFAVSGFDLCTGWGSPSGLGLINALAGVPNQPPAFVTNPFTEVSANAGQAYFASFATNASDPNGASLSYSKLAGPAWLGVTANGTLVGTPANTDAGTNTFLVRAVDSLGLSNSATLLIYVNGAPEFAPSPLAAPGINAGQAYSGSIADDATDPNGGDTLTFSKVSGPAWLTVAASGALSGTPSNADAGPNTFLVRVTDSGGLSATATLHIYVNGAPSFTSNPFAGSTATVGQPYSGSLATAAADPNGGTLTFAKLSGPAWLGVAGDGTLSGTPSLSDIGTNSFLVGVSDPGGLSDSATLSIIAVAPATPILLAISLQTTNIVLNWTGGFAPYQVQMTTDSSNPSWTNVGGPISANSLILTPTNTAAFYRIQGQ